MIQKRALKSALAAAILAAAAMAASAGGPGDRDRDRDRARNQIDLQMMENRLRGQIYNEQQQRYREQDRRDAVAPLPRPEVPIVRPGCAPGTAGSRFSGC
jgi:sugar (pentulose or hexulose) kinase